jgi:lactoylglutathione lyase
LHPWPFCTIPLASRCLRIGSMKLGYIIVYVPDVAAAVAFYEQAFGLAPRFVHDTGQYAEMETGATALAFAAEQYVSSSVQAFRRNRLEDQPAAVEIALIARNVAESFQKAVAAGASPVLEPVQKPWGQTVSYVRDRNGVLVEICSEVAA